MHLTRMKIKAGTHPAFQQDIELELNKRVNLFIGPNASGKTSLLRVLAGAAALGDSMGLHNSPQITLSDDWVMTQTEEQSPSWRIVHPREVDKRLLVVPWIYMPATRLSLPREFEKKFAPFGAYELIEGTSDNRLNIRWPDNVQMFDNEWAEHLVKRVFEHLRGEDKENGQFQRMLTLSIECAKHIAPEIYTGGFADHVIDPKDLFADEIHDTPPLLVEPYVAPAMAVSTKGSHPNGTSLQYAGQLSSGSQGVFLWVIYAALKIAYHYSFEENWHEKPAILLIDEIENHLHPTWQRRVIPALLEHFPGLQIFATTHSPFVVAGLKAGQVHVLNRDENGVVTASTNEQDVIGWTMDEVLRGMMGVDEPTDQLTVDRAKRLRELREKDTLTPEEETELAQLRRQVNSDFLSRGGLLETQRERYADLVQDFLRLRQKELTQDGE